MLSLQRRHFLRTATACLFAVTIPKVARAQWTQAAELLLKILGGVSAAVDIAQYIGKWFGDKRCAISVMELDDVKFQCELVMDSLDSEENGAIPLLTAFVQKKDGPSWHRARRSLGVLLNNGNSLMMAVNLVVTKLDSTTYPGSKEDIKNLYSGIDQIRPAVAYLASLPEKPEPDTVQMANSVLESISSLSSTAKVSIYELRAAADERQRISCP